MLEVFVEKMRDDFNAYREDQTPDGIQQTKHHGPTEQRENEEYQINEKKQKREWESFSIQSLN